MKPTTFLSTTLAIILQASSIVSGAALAVDIRSPSLMQNPFGSSGTSVDDKPIDGDSPVQLCDPFVPKLLDIHHINISPNPPERGQNLTIEATGNLKATITKGSYIDVEVRYGYIRLLTQRFDLCEQVEQVDLKCPIGPGEISINKKVELPDQIPPGNYIAIARAYTPEDKEITCLSAEVSFTPTFGIQIV